MSANPSEVEAKETSMSEADVKKKIDEGSKEFFGVRNLDEAEVYFTNLTPEHRFRLVNKLVTSAIESKEADTQLVSDLFSRAISKDLSTLSSFEEGFCPLQKSSMTLPLTLRKHSISCIDLVSLSSFIYLAFHPLA